MICGGLEIKKRQVGLNFSCEVNVGRFSVEIRVTQLLLAKRRRQVQCHGGRGYDGKASQGIFRQFLGDSVTKLTRVPTRR